MRYGMGKRLHATATIAVGLLSLFSVTANAARIDGDLIIVGNEVIERENSDDASGYIISLDTEVFPTSGFVLSWSLQAANAGDLALLIMRGNTIASVDYRSVEKGYNAFDFNPSVGDDIVHARYNVGLWIGSAAVQYSTPSSSDEQDGYDVVSYCSTAACATPFVPTAGAALPGRTLADTGWQYNQYRQYSVEVVDPPLAIRAAVPAPASPLLIGLGLLLFVASRRSRLA